MRYDDGVAVVCFVEIALDVADAGVVVVVPLLGSPARGGPQIAVLELLLRVTHGVHVPDVLAARRSSP